MPFDGWTGLDAPRYKYADLHVVALNADGRMELFARAYDPGAETSTSTAWHIWEAGEGWSDWADMGKPYPGGDLAALGLGLQNDGCLTFFTPPSSQVQTQPNNGWSNQWGDFFGYYGDAGGGGWIPNPVWEPLSSEYFVVAHEKNNTMNVFGISDDLLVRTYQTDRYSNNHHGWAGCEVVATQGANLTVEDFDVTVNEDGRMEAFVRMDDAHLLHAWQTAPYKTFTDYYQIENPSWEIVVQGRPAVAQNQDGRIEVCIRGSDGQISHMWQTAQNNGWSGWSPLGGQPQGDPVMGPTADGQLAILSQFADGSLWQVSQTLPNGTNGWGDWTSIGGDTITATTLQRNLNGQLFAFISASDSLWFREITL
jgi:hypothetical protein